MIEERMAQLHGRTLHRLILRPDGKTRAGMIFQHGQGDYIDRYPQYLEPFLEAGIEIILTDLPGHGRSPGRRGEVPGMSFVDDLLADSLKHFPQNLPIGIAGHSMGGMLALRSYLKEPKLYSFAWFSSPLLEPTHGVSPLLRCTLMALAKVVPWLTYSTGVKTSDCRSGPSPEKTGEELYHASITLGWARELIEASELIRESFPTLSRKKPILITQGELDSVCPPLILQEKLGKLPSSPTLSYEEIPEALHEPFTGEHQMKFKEILSQWVEHSLSPMV